MKPIKIQKEGSIVKKSGNELLNKIKYVNSKERHNSINWAPISKQSIMNLDYIFVNQKSGGNQKEARIYDFLAATGVYQIHLSTAFKELS